MKPGPILAMVGLLVAGMALVLQPTLTRSPSDVTIRIGQTEIRALNAQQGYRIVAPERLATEAPISAEQLRQTIDAELAGWQARPFLERTLLGFLNVSGWSNLVWIGVGLGGQAAFFGRMFIQWVVSEKRRQSQVPELFWWLSFLGGVCLFTYFVWRVDVIGVLGQSTGVVIYARNLRLIQKQKRRDRRAANAQPEGDGPLGRKEATDAGAA
ncbi:MAG: lipid-A-disaccharide synthase N-terminal domain-containing protein [Planctomycetota bacterium]